MAHLFDVTTPGLERFLDAQASVCDEVVNELRQGKKQTHWMWFIFPQLASLGRSAMARHFGLSDLDEARAYLNHPVLGERLRACCELALKHPELTAQEMLGSIDAIKLRACATLFLQASGGAALFQTVLDTFYDGIPDPMTLEHLSH
ncbi:DUF1810 domain-containing protein [Hydrogenophaga atypica]|uniref:DUF1810 domain-containing protein n=1 Tax=Hydrogenophaga atypica TaxID=249409 RepID=A0ABW2QJH6_9BURK